LGRGVLRWLRAAVAAASLMLITLGAVAAHAGPARAADHVVTNPLPIACPDPDALKLSQRPYRVVVDCTSDRDQHAPHGSAFAMYTTSNLRRLHRFGYVFPRGHEPWWSIRSPRGSFWGPTIQRIGRNYVVYFAAEFNPAKIHLFRSGHRLRRGTKVIGVAWGPDLHHLYEHTRILHYTSELNRVRGSFRETFGGVIDPSVARDPETGVLYLSYTEQPNRTMLTQLTPDGVHTVGPTRLISWGQLPWEDGTEEGSVLMWNPQISAMTATVNAASTWKGTYRVGYLVSFDPRRGRFYKYPDPILQGGNRLYGPGMGSAPLLGPDGSSYWVYVHVQRHPSHHEMRRFLALEPWHWSGLSPMSLRIPVLMQGHASTLLESFPVPLIGTGRPNRHVVTPFLALLDHH
jgi:hypothetical protein